MSKTKRAVIYVRVSTEEQAQTDGEGLSIPHQLEECRRTAKELEADVVEEYVEAGRSARSTKRPQLQRMLERIHDERDIDLVIVHKVNRLARNTRDALAIETDLMQYDCRLASATETWDDSPMGDFMKLILHGQAELYSAQLSEEVRTKTMRKAFAGGTIGRAPIGYLNIRKTVDGIPNVATVEIDEERADDVRWAFTEFAKGHHTVRALAEDLELRGLRTRATPKLPSRPISRNALNKLLRNPYYIGLVTYAGQRHQGRHERLIDVETFDKVQEVLDSNNTGGDKSWRYKHYLKGSLFCGHCGSRMGFVHGRGTGGEYQYYYCLGRQQKNGCEQRHVPIHMAEEAVVAYYPAIAQLIEPHLDTIDRRVRKRVETWDEDVRLERRRLKRDLQRLNDEQQRFMQLYVRGNLSQDLAEAELERINREISTTESALALQVGRSESIEKAWNAVVSIAERAPDAYAASNDNHRRIHNRFWFKRLFLVDTEIVEHEWADMPALIATSCSLENDDTASSEAVSSGTELCENGQNEHRVASSNIVPLVGTGRFELPTPCSQSRCATKLRHVP